MMEIVGQWGWLLSMLLSGVLTWVVWSLAAHFVGQKECNSLRSGDKDTKEKTDTKLWSAIEGLKDQQHRLELKVSEVQGSLQAARVEISGTREVVLQVESNVKLLLRGHLGHNMNNLRELIEKNRRLCILQLLHEDTDYSLNLAILQTALTSLGHGVSRNTLVADAIWLEEAGMLKLSNSDNQAFMVLSLGSRGQDVAKGLATHPGIDRVLA